VTQAGNTTEAMTINTLDEYVQQHKQHMGDVPWLQSTLDPCPWPHVVHENDRDNVIMEVRE